MFDKLLIDGVEIKGIREVKIETIKTDDLPAVYYRPPDVPEVTIGIQFPVGVSNMTNLETLIDGSHILN